MRQGTRPVHVQKPNFSEAFPEAVIREGADEVTLRAEEVGTLKACINVDRIEDDRWEPPLIDADWHAFCQAMYKGIEGKEWEELNYHFRELSQAAGAEKPSESQKTKLLWAMKAAWDRQEEFHVRARKEHI